MTFELQGQEGDESWWAVCQQGDSGLAEYTVIIMLARGGEKSIQKLLVHVTANPNGFNENSSPSWDIFYFKEELQINTAFPIAFKSGLIGAIPSSESEDDIHLRCLGGMLN